MTDVRQVVLRFQKLFPEIHQELFQDMKGI